MPVEAPLPEDVNRTIYEVAARSLEGEPVGTVAMIGKCIGYKKMGFCWNRAVYGLWPAMGIVYRDIVAKYRKRYGR